MIDMQDFSCYDFGFTINKASRRSMRQ